ncbi:hypothetical protein Q8W71_29215 [Methylobacterium sp. NEAU 140]|uniref:hypothetical protein n=1 Tax=Methylobacterium sp. NEAU 140 TaxID=3064945 RepID=UPI0027350CFF|nr:hypothetical protein [Methylobacterium sp. NEAU 140]MDP4026691.1 hypothetical protein [Methylobacterium sp. NEAU 140]
MADLIKFPGKGRRSATYQLHRFAVNGSPCGTALILARDDADATRKAYAVTEGLRADLWLGRRFVNSFAATDQPIAASIRLLSDPAPGQRR